MTKVKVKDMNTEQYVKVNSHNVVDKYCPKEVFFNELLNKDISLFKIKDNLYGMINGKGRYHIGTESKG